MSVFTVPGNALGLPPDPGTKPTGAHGVTLGPFGSLRDAPPEAVADAVVGVHVYDHRPAAAAREALRWVLGINRYDGAGLGIAVAEFTDLYRLVAHRSADGVAVWQRVRAQPVEYRLNAPPRPVEVVTGDDLMSGANAKAARAARVFTDAQVDAIRRVVREEISRA